MKGSLGFRANLSGKTDVQISVVGGKNLATPSGLSSSHTCMWASVVCVRVCVHVCVYMYVCVCVCVCVCECVCAENTCTCNYMYNVHTHYMQSHKGVHYNSTQVCLNYDPHISGQVQDTRCPT